MGTQDPQDPKTPTKQKEGYRYTLEEALPKEKINEIVKRKWKVAEVPSKEELAKEKPVSPQARPNQNSRKNLAQYKERTEESKAKSIENLLVPGETPKIKREADARQAVLGFPDEEAFFKRWGDQGFAHELIKTLIPSQIFSPDESQVYFQLVDAFLGEFSPKDITASDIDSLLELVMARVQQLRLMKLSKGTMKNVVDASQTMAKLGTQISAIKKDLSTRRVDRLKTKGAEDYSILDLVAASDDVKRAEKAKMLEKYEVENKEYQKKLDDRGYQE